MRKGVRGKWGVGGGGGQGEAGARAGRWQCGIDWAIDITQPLVSLGPVYSQQSRCLCIHMYGGGRQAERHVLG